MRSTMIALLCAAGAAFAADPKTGEGSLYYPVKEGAKRVSEVKVGDRTIEITIPRGHGRDHRHGRRDDR